MIYKLYLINIPDSVKNNVNRTGHFDGYGFSDDTGNDNTQISKFNQDILDELDSGRFIKFNIGDISNLTKSQSIWYRNQSFQNFIKLTVDDMGDLISLNTDKIALADKRFSLNNIDEAFGIVIINNIETDNFKTIDINDIKFIGRPTITGTSKGFIDITLNGLENILSKSSFEYVVEPKYNCNYNFKDYYEGVNNICNDPHNMRDLYRYPVVPYQCPKETYLKRATSGAFYDTVKLIQGLTTYNECEFLNPKTKELEKWVFSYYNNEPGYNISRYSQDGALISEHRTSEFEFIKGTLVDRDANIEFVKALVDGNEKSYANYMYNYDILNTLYDTLHYYFRPVTVFQGSKDFIYKTNIAFKGAKCAEEFDKLNPEKRSITTLTDMSSTISFDNRTGDDESFQYVHFKHNTISEDDILILMEQKIDRMFTEEQENITPGGVVFLTNTAHLVVYNLTNNELYWNFEVSEKNGTQVISGSDINSVESIPLPEQFIYNLDSDDLCKSFYFRNEAAPEYIVPGSIPSKIQGGLKFYMADEITRIVSYDGSSSNQNIIDRYHRDYYAKIGFKNAATQTQANSQSFIYTMSMKSFPIRLESATGRDAINNNENNMTRDFTTMPKFDSLTSYNVQRWEQTSLYTADPEHYYTICHNNCKYGNMNAVYTEDVDTGIRTFVQVELDAPILNHKERRNPGWVKACLNDIHRNVIIDNYNSIFYYSESTSVFPVYLFSYSKNITYSSRTVNCQTSADTPDFIDWLNDIGRNKVVKFFQSFTAYQTLISRSHTALMHPVMYRLKHDIGDDYEYRFDSIGCGHPIRNRVLMSELTGNINIHYYNEYNSGAYVRDGGILYQSIPLKIENKQVVEGTSIEEGKISGGFQLYLNAIGTSGYCTQMSNVLLDNNDIYYIDNAITLNQTFYWYRTDNSIIKLFPKDHTRYLLVNEHMKEGLGTDIRQLSLQSRPTVELSGDINEYKIIGCINDRLDTNYYKLMLRHIDEGYITMCDIPKIIHLGMEDAINIKFSTSFNDELLDYNRKCNVGDAIYPNYLRTSFPFKDITANNLIILFNYTNNVRQLSFENSRLTGLIAMNNSFFRNMYTTNTSGLIINDIESYNIDDHILKITDDNIIDLALTETKYNNVLFETSYASKNDIENIDNELEIKQADISKYDESVSINLYASSDFSGKTSLTFNSIGDLTTITFELENPFVEKKTLVLEVDNRNKFTVPVIFSKNTVGGIEKIDYRLYKDGMVSDNEWVVNFNYNFFDAIIESGRKFVIQIDKSKLIGSNLELKLIDDIKNNETNGLFWADTNNMNLKTPFNYDKYRAVYIDKLKSYMMIGEGIRDMSTVSLTCDGIYDVNDIGKICEVDSFKYTLSGYKFDEGHKIIKSDIPQYYIEKMVIDYKNCRTSMILVSI